MAATIASMLDPKTVATVVSVLVAVAGVAYYLGRRAALGFISADLKHLHEDLERAHATPEPDDDKAVEEQIRAKERVQAALSNLPDRM